jgi:rod shape-determining protein MreC
LKLENQFLKSELSTADRAKSLAVFQERSRSRTVAARVIGTGTGANSKVVFIDRGKSDGVQRGMPVITPDGIVGKVTFVFPSAAQVLLITDPTFAAGVISQKNRVPGTLKGLGRSQVQVDWVQNEVKVEEGEWFFTSGDDRVFPKGLPAGQAKVVKSGLAFKEIYLDPSGLMRGLEEVLVVLEGVHSAIPEGPMPPEGPVFVMTPPPAEAVKPAAGATTTDGLPPLSTDADRLREKIRRIGEVQGVQFGNAGSRLPNFNMDPAQVSRPVTPLFVPPVKPPEPKPEPAQTPPPAAAANQP